MSLGGTMKRQRRSSSRIAARGGAPEPEGETVDFGVGYMEDNVLAMLDSQGVKDAESIRDDKLSFLDVVFEEFVMPEKARPSKSIYRAVYSCLRESKSMEVAMASYRLLKDLDEVVISYASEVPYKNVSCITSLNLSSLARDLMVKESPICAFPVKTLVFRHFIDQLVKDFEQTRASFDGANMERFCVYKQLEMCGGNSSFDKILLELLHFSLEGVTENNSSLQYFDIIYKSTQALISLLFHLDELKTSLTKDYIDQLVDKLFKNNGEKMPIFLEAIQKPEQKLQFVMECFVKLFSSRRPPIDFSSFEVLLQRFDDRTAQVLLKESQSQLLLAHAFQAILCINPSDGSSIAGLFIAAFEKLQAVPRDFIVHPTAKQALVVAEVLSNI
ncbi:negative regulator of systemic acquired resistance SNI1 [Selaginella moellendorffii]|uniref:negative regulator of systemic acquired resistance SNI1 n=1 Tax=Selaginella moellendorffii TaxID=88036 RepID=UPI000D1C60C2|nr:negative regulator of systemic acquired resistance SNI1 [Selaginella moellendorffii]XP_024530322.1 negative regulator of systemic acquired resistance SNI1 [Selaginella moellendorffii]|eukprot:XP_024530321.1 negative regulator of systemic acquired resistance SNI1 [Selaginella moellendorffii]